MPFRFSDTDELGRIPAGSVPGWGLSWWLAEQGISNETWVLGYTPEQRFSAWSRCCRDVAEGWWPAVPRDDWVGAHDPFAPDH